MLVEQTVYYLLADVNEKFMLENLVNSTGSARNRDEKVHTHKRLLFTQINQTTTKKRKIQRIQTHKKRRFHRTASYWITWIKTNALPSTYDMVSSIKKNEYQWRIESSRGSTLPGVCDMKSDD